MPRSSSNSSSSAREDSSSSSSQQKDVATTIVVDKISTNVSEAHLRQIFSHFGPVQSVFIKLHPRLNRLYALVKYALKADAQQAITYLNTGQIDGIKVSISLQEPKIKDSPLSKNRSRSRQKQRKLRPRYQNKYRFNHSSRGPRKTNRLKYYRNQKRRDSRDSPRSSRVRRNSSSSSGVTSSQSSSSHSSSS